MTKTYALCFDCGCPRAEGESPEEALDKIKEALHAQVEDLDVTDMWEAHLT